MTDADGPVFMTYIPKLLYRDLAGITDPHHADALRARDLEVFTANGPFCRRAVPGEFVADDMSRMDINHFVVVSFNGGHWRRQLGARRTVTVIKTRGGKR